MNKDSFLNQLAPPQEQQNNPTRTIYNAPFLSNQQIRHATRLTFTKHAKLREKFRAKHGCFPEEALLSNNISVEKSKKKRNAEVMKLTWLYELGRWLVWCGVG